MTKGKKENKKKRKTTNGGIVYFFKTRSGTHDPTIERKNGELDDETRVQDGGMQDIGRNDDMSVRRETRKIVVQG